MRMRVVRIGMALSCVALFAVGCSLPIPVTITTDFTLLGNVTIPPNDLGWIESGYFEDEGQFCNLPSLDILRDLATEHIGSFGRYVELRSAKVTKIRFEASEGNFNRITRVEVVLRADGDPVINVFAQDEDGFGTQIVLPNKDSINLAAIIMEGGVACLDYYVLMEGALPESRLVFDVAMDLELRFALRLF